jgi:hypothetical protein
MARSMGATSAAHEFQTDPETASASGWNWNRDRPGLVHMLVLAGTSRSTCRKWGDGPEIGLAFEVLAFEIRL